MILLVDRFGPDAQRLLSSLEEAGYPVRLLSIVSDGFLPPGTLSPFSWEEEGEGGELYFDKLSVPSYWEIRSSTTSGEVYKYEDLRGKLFYASPKYLRNIRIVDWLDRQGKARFSDHYDQYGHRFAQTILDEQERLLLRIYYDREGRERIVENFRNGLILCKQEGKQRAYRSRTEFVASFLLKQGADKERVLLNTLGAGFFALKGLRSSYPLSGGEKDVLFWQEELGEEMPGPLLSAIEGREFPLQVAVQNRQAYERLLRAGVSEASVTKIGFCYPFARKSEGRRKVLIFTNSDQVVHLSELADALPQLTFYVGAITEMSQRLLSLGQRENVRLFPVMRIEKAASLLAECDFYLDINRGGEILNAVEEAFLQNMPILAFSQTLHNPRYVSPTCIFEEEEVEEMVEFLAEAVRDASFMKNLIQNQREYAMAAEGEDYVALLGGNKG